jgi:hypothetical protein
MWSTGAHVAPLPLPVPGMIKTHSLTHDVMIIPDAMDVQDGRMGACPDATIRGQGVRRTWKLCRAQHPSPDRGGPHSRGEGDLSRYDRT